MDISRRRITVNTALRLARYFDAPHQFWINLQTNYEVDGARRAAGAAIERIQPRQTDERLTWDRWFKGGAVNEEFMAEREQPDQQGL